MKLLSFLQQEKQGQQAYLYIGECPFQREAFLSHCMVLYEGFSRQRISLMDTPVEDVISLFSQPRLVSKTQLFLVEDPQVVSTQVLVKLVQAVLSGKNPNLKRILFLNSKPSGLQIDSNPPLIFQESKSKKNLIDITCALMNLRGLPVDKVLAKGIVQSNQQSPLSILSELRKLELVFDKEQGTYSVKDVLPLVEKDPTEHLFGFLDRLGTRSLKKSLVEYLSISKQELEDGNRLLALMKSHFRKLMDLKNWTEPLDELRLVKFAHRYFTAVSYREKERQVQGIRTYYEETLDEDEFERFSKVFRSDYYLCKLLYQQRAYKREELFSILQDFTSIQGKIQSSNTPLEPQLVHLLYEYCNRDMK